MRFPRFSAVPISLARGPIPQQRDRFLPARPADCRGLRTLPCIRSLSCGDKTGRVSVPCSAISRLRRIFCLYDLRGEGCRCRRHGVSCHESAGESEFVTDHESETVNAFETENATDSATLSVSDRVRPDDDRQLQHLEIDRDVSCRRQAQRPPLPVFDFSRRERMIAILRFFPFHPGEGASIQRREAKHRRRRLCLPLLRRDQPMENRLDLLRVLFHLPCPS